MNERLKEIIIYIVIGCTGVVGMEIAVLLATYIIEGPSEELADHTLAVVGAFFWAMLWGAIFYNIFKKKDIANIKLETRKKVISNQLYIITTLIVLVTMLLVVFIVKQIKEGIIFSGAFIFALLFWETGCILADKIIQKDVKDINQKLKEKNAK